MSQDSEPALVAYEQHHQAVRALNQQMWQVPVLAMTLTGGLWFGAGKIEFDPWGQAALFALAAIGNIAFIITLWRVRTIIAAMLVKIEEMYPEFHVDTSTGHSMWSRQYVVIMVWSVVLGLATVMSGLMAWTAAPIC